LVDKINEELDGGEFWGRGIEVVVVCVEILNVVHSFSPYRKITIHCFQYIVHKKERPTFAGLSKCV
jgi:hypothetical protein